MSLQLGDFDADGEGERIVFEMEDTEYPINPELAALLITLLVLATCSLICWGIFLVISKWGTITVWFRHVLHHHEPPYQQSPSHGAPTRPTAITEASAPTVTIGPKQYVAYPCVHHCGYNPQHFSSGQLPTTGICQMPGSFANPSYRTPDWKQLSEPDVY